MRKRQQTMGAPRLLPLLLLLLVAALGLAGCSGGAQPDESAASDRVTAFIGDLAASASASGQVIAARAVDLALASPGTVAEIYVTEGDTVAAGDPLLTLESDDLVRAVATAEQNLTLQEANLAQLRSGASAADYAAAEAALRSAESARAALLEGPTAQQLANGEANVRAAQANLDSAQASLTQLRTSGATDADILSARNNLAAAEEQQLAAQRAHEQTLLCTELPNGAQFCAPPEVEERARYAASAANARLAAAQAQLNALLAGADANAIAVAQAGVDSAQANLDAAEANLALLTSDPSAQQLAAADVQVAQATATLARLEAGAGAEQIAIGTAQVAQAQINLERARANLADATLRAPFAGVITTINTAVGQQAAGPVVALEDVTQFEVALQVDELDMGALALGQEATVFVDAFADETLTGSVVAIAPQNTPSADTLVTYDVRLRLDPAPVALRVNMTVNADLVTAERSGVLLVANRAIAIDRQQGTYTVQRIISGADGETTETVAVTVGLRDGQYSEILSGLAAGDELLIGNDIPRLEFGPPGGGA